MLRWGDFDGKHVVFVVPHVHARNAIVLSLSLCVGVNLSGSLSEHLCDAHFLLLGVEEVDDTGSLHGHVRQVRAGLGLIVCLCS